MADKVVFWSTKCAKDKLELWRILEEMGGDASRIKEYMNYERVDWEHFPTVALDTELGNRITAYPYRPNVYNWPEDGIPAIVYEVLVNGAKI